MVMVFLGNHLFECELFSSLVDFSGEFYRVRVTCKTPDLISGVFNQRDPEEVTTLLSVRRELAKGRKLI